MLNILCLDLHFDVTFQLLNLLVFRYVAEFYKYPVMMLMIIIININNIKQDI